MVTDLQKLVAWGVDTIYPHSRDSGWLEWIERGTITWDDKIAYDDVTFLEFYLSRVADHCRHCQKVFTGLPPWGGHTIGCDYAVDCR